MTATDVSRATVPTSRGPMRRDIQLLRALAVALVVGYHVWPSGVPAGYVGVDVFFVISGFLIISGLVDEFRATGRVGLGAFWARRIKRLLPAALLVLAVTFAATLVILPGSQQPEALKEIVASTVYLQNWLLAANSVDYLAAANIASPVQHFWSLSVEEQFYVAFPLLLALGVLISRRAGVAVTLSLVFLASLAVSVWATAVSPAPAYFITPTRAWEFAAGGLLAFAPARPGLPRMRSVVAWTGWLLIAASAFGYDPQTPFPGVAAAVPVVATVAVIWAAAPEVSRVPAILRRAAVHLGDISYSVYLWHWPAIVFASQVLADDFGVVPRLGVIVVVLVLALLTWRFVENPVRSWAPGAKSTTFVAAAVAMSLIAVPAAASWEAIRAANAAELAAAHARAAAQEACFGAEFRAPGAGCPEGLYTTLTPDPAAAVEDRGESYEGCIAGDADARVIRCSYGTATGDLRVAIVGDSHASALEPAIRRLQLENGWALVTYFKSACPQSSAMRHYPDLAIQQSCADWNVALAAELEAEAPFDLVFVTHTVAIDLTYDSEAAAIAGYRGAWQQFTSRGSRVVVIRDVPRMTPVTPVCLAQHEGDPRPCDVPIAASLAPRDLMVEAAEGQPDVFVADLTDSLCWDGTCKAAVGGVVTFRDTHHLTNTFATTLAPALARELVRLGLDDALSRDRTGAP